MRDLRLDGIQVCASWLTQRSFEAAYCEFLLNITRKNKAKALATFKKDEEERRTYSGLRISGIADLSFLKDFPDLLYLEIVDQKRVNTRCLDGLENLRGLRLESPGAGIDFACFPHLEVFVGDWHADNHNVDRSGELRQLRAWHFNPCTRDLSDLANITRLEWLTLTQTNITSLVGLETLEDLRYLELAYAARLDTLDAFAAGPLGIREIEIYKANKISCYEPIAFLNRLRRLKLSSCSRMSDLKWTRKLTHLDFFSFVDTIVEDGDLSVLLKLPRLRYVGTFNKRHYNYKCDELNEILKGRVSVTAVN